MKIWFLNKGYNEPFVDTEVSKVKFLNTYGNKRTKPN